MKEFIKGDLKYIVNKDDNGLYSYQSQEFSKICNKWINMSKAKNFTRSALEDFLDIRIDF